MAGQVLQFIMNCLVLTISVSGYQVFKTKTLHGFVYLALVPKAYKVWASVCACPRTWSREPKTMAMSGLKLADLQLSVDSSLAYFETRKHFCALNWMDKFRCTQHVPPPASQPINVHPNERMVLVPTRDALFENKQTDRHKERQKSNRRLHR